ncbi:hypothetical protein AALP_AA1G122000 [Arabis alpina]|uniref:Uncharacterized protein n=1 Tax=Arabis alpina TaxID=50452 RepID=A0A087HMQ5_ARAAL|nr:hypothetical protein AALP_AA1G122000 [Arabis alpina]
MAGTEDAEKPILKLKLLVDKKKNKVVLAESARCSCGALMGKEIEASYIVAHDEIFVSNKTLFTITDKLEVGFSSMGLTLKTLKNLGYTDTTQLQEMLVDVDHDKVLALLQCLFSSDTPLTDVFLMKSVITTPILPLEECYAGITGSNEAPDDLIITPMNLSSNICSLKTWNIDLDDIEEQVVTISKTEASRLLRASFLTSTALSTVFGSLLSKKPKVEKL